jgi:hypothetical protein
MLKKEFNEILKQSLYLVIFVVCLSPVLLIGSRVSGSPLSYLQALIPVFQVGVLIFALITGISLFTSERKQDGIEYLLTLPISRFKLLAIKILPRLTGLLVFLVLYVLPVQMLPGGAESTYLTYALPTGIFLFMVFSLFIIALSLSASHHNFLLLSLLTLVIFTVYAALIYLLLRRGLLYLIMGYFNFSHVGMVAVFLLILPLPLLLSFIFSFKKFDAGPGKSFNRCYLKFFIPFLIIGLALSVIYLYTVNQPLYINYYLTGEHKLIEMKNTKSRLYDGEKVIRIDAGGHVMLEHEGFLYINEFTDRKKILRLNKKNYRVETVYTSDGWIRIPGSKYKDTLAFIERTGEPERRLVLLNLHTEAVKKFKLPETGKGDFFSPSIVGADEEGGKRFWLTTAGKRRKYSIFRIWEDGRTEKIGVSRTIPIYVNRMLLTQNKKGIVVSKIMPHGVEVIKELPLGTDITFITGYFRKCLDKGSMKEIYARAAGTFGRILWIDMEKLEMKWLQGASSSYLRYIPPDQYYYTEWDYDNEKKLPFVKRISRLKNGKIELLKEFQPGKYQWMFPHSHGFFLKVDGKVKIYAIPGMKELTFKGLD